MKIMEVADVKIGMEFERVADSTPAYPCVAKIVALDSQGNATIVYQRAETVPAAWLTRFDDALGYRPYDATAKAAADAFAKAQAADPQGAEEAPPSTKEAP